MIILGKDKLGIPASEPVRLVLESDGTQVEDGEYFRTLANNTILLLLRQGERWYPAGVDVIKAGELKVPKATSKKIFKQFPFLAISAIPKIVCEVSKN